MMVDASDMHLLCGADELLAKRRVLTGGDDNTVVVGGVTKCWGRGPEHCEQSEHVRRQHSTKDVTTKTTDHN